MKKPHCHPPTNVGSTCVLCGWTRSARSLNAGPWTAAWPTATIKGWFYRNGGDGLYEAWLAGRAAGTSEAATQARIHSQYPIRTDFDRGYDRGRFDAAEAIRKTPNV